MTWPPSMSVLLSCCTVQWRRRPYTMYAVCSNTGTRLPWPCYRVRIKLQANTVTVVTMLGGRITNITATRHRPHTRTTGTCYQHPNTACRMPMLLVRSIAKEFNDIDMATTASVSLLLSIERQRVKNQESSAYNIQVDSGHPEDLEDNTSGRRVLQNSSISPPKCRLAGQLYIVRGAWTRFTEAMTAE